MEIKRKAEEKVEAVGQSLLLFGKKSKKTGKEALSYNLLRGRLEEIIHDLLINDLSKLVNILYRIDVHEAKVNQAMRQLSSREIASAIAQLVIDRQIAKIATRQNYT